MYHLEVHSTKIKRISYFFWSLLLYKGQVLEELLKFLVKALAGQLKLGAALGLKSCYYRKNFSTVVKYKLALENFMETLVLHCWVIEAWIFYEINFIKLMFGD